MRYFIYNLLNNASFCTVLNCESKAESPAYLSSVAGKNVNEDIYGSPWELKLCCRTFSRRIVFAYCKPTWDKNRHFLSPVDWHKISSSISLQLLQPNSEVEIIDKQMPKPKFYSSIPNTVVKSLIDQGSRVESLSETTSLMSLTASKRSQSLVCSSAIRTMCA